MPQENRRILVATTNPGKIAEIRAMLGAETRWLSLGEVGAADEIAEDGATFAENARKKALGYARAAGLWTIADDSGLIVDALDGAPGVKSARFSGARPDDHDRRLIDRRNMAKVLCLLNGVPKERRTARFVCCLCLADPEKVLLETEGTLEGLISDTEIGENGFGYDPIFFVPHLKKTVAQLTCEEKNAISHRGNAIRKLKGLLDELLRAS
ncbi:MAG: RdgB/HAM1 family non-canonical purine NTP pyrophosphatase [Phycisphaerales bacterium]|nr:MAG: RdgB/HAM1 family non-canonical purine NTP pyrophosphatase [Phycisphaerales bacterium]